MTDTTNTNTAPADTAPTPDVPVQDRSVAVRVAMDYSEGRTGLLATARRNHGPATGKLEPTDRIDIPTPSGGTMRGVPIREAVKLGLLKADPDAGFVETSSDEKIARMEVEASGGDPNAAAEDPMERAETFADPEGVKAIDLLAGTVKDLGGDFINVASVYLSSGELPRDLYTGRDPALVDGVVAQAFGEGEKIVRAACLHAGIPSGKLDAFFEDLAQQPGGRHKAAAASIRMLATGSVREWQSLARSYMQRTNPASATDRVTIRLPSGKTLQTTAATAARHGLQPVA